MVADRFAVGWDFFILIYSGIAAASRRGCPASGGPRHANHHVPNASGGRVSALGTMLRQRPAGDKSWPIACSDTTLGTTGQEIST